MTAKHIIAALVLAASAGAHADDLRASAVRGHAADLGSTGIGLAVGAAEANPLGILAMGVKAIAYQQINAAPAVEQPALWSATGAFGWGAAANNVCILAAIATGGALAAVCPVIGAAAGLAAYSADEDVRNRATFDAICAQQRSAMPDLVCTYDEQEAM